MSTPPVPVHEPSEFTQRFDRAFSVLRRKAVTNLLRAWRGLEDSARSALNADIRPDVPKEDIERLRRQMRECLEAKGGEVSARARTVELGQTYLSLSAKGKHRFLSILAESFDVDRKAVDAAVEKLQSAKPAQRAAAEAALRTALQAPRVQILKQFNALPNGFKFLVDLRADLLQAVEAEPALAGLEGDLKQLLASWFDVGLLDLEEISWSSPAALLEKLIDYEAVHAISSWSDLKNRLDSDRRCFAFFHGKMQGEPLIFVEVALVKGMADNVQRLLDETEAPLPEGEADTAIFYSISNAQSGLAGISFGNFLIKRVVQRLSGQLPNLKTFATLSPVPGFRAWLETKDAVLNKTLDVPWHEDKGKAERLKPTLTRLITQYLVQEKRKTRALDPVAHFHLSNGAVLERVNWLGDTSKKGLRQSAGMMVNYHYKLSEIDDNHERYAGTGTVTSGKPVKALLKE